MLKQPLGFDPINDNWGIGYSCGYGGALGGPGASTTGVNRGHFSRMIAGGLVGVLRVSVLTSSGNYDLGIYEGSGAGENALPTDAKWTMGGTPVPVAGDISVTVSPSVITYGKSDWYALSANNITATFRSGQSHSSVVFRGWLVIQAGAYPLPATAIPAYTATATAFIFTGRPT